MSIPSRALTAPVSDDDGETLCDHDLGDYPGTEGLVVLVCALLAGLLAKAFLSKTRVPYTVLLTLFGALMGAIHTALRTSNLYGPSALATSNLAYVEVSPHTLLFIFLPVLIFESALNCDWHIFKRQFAVIISLAVPGVLFSAYATAYFLKYVLHPGWSMDAALMTGAILSATDPVAVVALMKELGVSEKLGTLMEGESLLNDVGLSFLRSTHLLNKTDLS